MTQEICISEEARDLLSVITTDFCMRRDGFDWIDREKAWQEVISRVDGNTGQFKEALDALYKAARPTGLTVYLDALDMMASSFTPHISPAQKLRSDSRRILGLVLWNAIDRPKVGYYDWQLLDQTALQIVDKMHLPTDSEGEVSLLKPVQFHPAYFLTRLLANQVDISPHAPLP